MNTNHYEDLPEDINRDSSEEQDYLQESTNNIEQEEVSEGNEQKIPGASDCVYIPEEVYECLPDILKDLTALFTDRERDVVLLSSLCTLSGVLPNVFGMYGKNTQYCNLYLLIVAPPASGKGVMNFAKHLVTPIHRKIYMDSLESRNSCQEENKNNKTNKPCPPIKVVIIPGNISSAEFYSMLKNADHGTIMIESEGDTLSNALKQDFGNFSDVLRKAFHHEDLSISRKTDSLYLEITEPKLSLVISGTEDQIIPIVKSKENGLFSRFLYYSFNNNNEWKDVFDVDTTVKEAFVNTGKERVLHLYLRLLSLEKPVEFNLADRQRHRFNSEMSDISEIVNEYHPPLFSSSVKRHGVIFFRLLMIMAVLRNENEIGNRGRITISDEDFEAVLLLIKAMLRHALHVFLSVTEGGLNQLEDDFLYSLPETFTREQAIELGETVGLAKRTVDYKLKIWTNKKFIKKIKHGQYKRL